MIKTFNITDAEYKALDAVAHMLNVLCTNGYHFKVKDVYFDVGQDWKWTTIIAEKDDDSYQLLYPRDHELITECICLTRLEQALNNIINDADRYTHLAKFR